MKSMYQRYLTWLGICLLLLVSIILFEPMAAPGVLLAFAATFQFSQSYGAGETKADVGDGSGGNYWNFKSIDDATAANYSSNPIVAGEDSFEVYIQGHFTGTFNAISNVLFWASDLVLTGYGTGAALKASVVIPGDWAQASEVANADSAIPTTEGTALELAYAAAFSDYVRMQLHTTTTAAVPGDGGTTTFTMQYDES